MRTFYPSCKIVLHSSHCVLPDLAVLAPQEHQTGAVDARYKRQACLLAASFCADGSPPECSQYLLADL